MAKEQPKIQTQAPAFQEDPRFAQGLEDLLTTGRKLTNFDFTGGLAPLQDTISTSPETTALFLQGLEAQLGPKFRDLQQETISQLAASNQLESSVAVDRLARGQEDLQSNILAATTQFGLADINRALENRVRLSSLGLQATEAGTGQAAGAEGRLNEFNLANFENQLALELANRPQQTGGLFGGLAGGFGGAALGLGAAALAIPTGGFSLAAAAPFIGAGALGGGLLGGFGPAGTGGQLLQAGAGSLGRINPRSAATSKSIRDLPPLEDFQITARDLAFA